MNDTLEPFDPRVSSPLGRAQTISRALADAARRARFSSRARGAYGKTSFEERRGSQAMRFVTLALFVVLVAIPNLTAILYFGFMASDQFVSEAKFTVSSGAIPKLDGFGSVTGIPSMMIVQDTQIITNYIESRTMVEQLERQLNLRELYGSQEIDWWARFKKKKPIEKFTDYWVKMVEAKISLPAGIVTLTVRAFAPVDAKHVADTVISNCETLINNLNERMRRDTVLASEQDMQRASERLKIARLNLEQARNAEGLIDVHQANKSQSELLAGLEGDLLKAQQEYETQLHYVSETAPQLRVLKSRIEALNAQVAEMKAQLTAQEKKGISALVQRTLSGKMTKFADLDLEHQIAERRYAAAIATLDAARIMSERKMLYLHQIEAPAVPEEPRYPKRWLSVGTIFGISLILWGICVGLMSFVRNHMA